MSPPASRPVIRSALGGHNSPPSPSRNSRTAWLVTDPAHPRRAAQRQNSRASSMPVWNAPGALLKAGLAYVRHVG
ncbi:MAG: hypothetical protein U1E05_25085, partial [Patescibacteria group bacterium]|nr:hypothetical protein [Patescibacteria group bacterium]